MEQELEGDHLDDLNRFTERALVLEHKLEDAAEHDYSAAAHHFPSDFAITAAYPNPFNSMTRIAYSLPSETDFRIALFDATGRQVALLNEGRRGAGHYQAVWNSLGAPAGVYFCRLKAGELESSLKLVLVK